MARVKGMQFQIKKGEVAKTFRSRGDAAEYLEVPDWTLKTAMKNGLTHQGWTLSYVPRATTPTTPAATPPAKKPPRLKQPKAHSPSPMASTSLAPVAPLPITHGPLPVSDVLSTLATLHAKNIQITFEPGKTTITIAELAATKAA